MGRPRVEIKEGQVFGSLTAVAEAGVDANRNSQWRCQCACGAESTVRAHRLKSGAVQQCSACSAAAHGLAQRKYTEVLPDVAAKNTPEHQAWTGLRFNAKETGVPFEPDWQNFTIFYTELGRRPDDDYVLGRIDTERGYVRGNVEWQPRMQRQQHKVNSLWWYVYDERYPSAQAAALALGISRGKVRDMCQGPWNRDLGRRDGPERSDCYTKPQFPHLNSEESR